MGDIHIPDSAVADYNRMEHRAAEYSALSTHSRILLKLESDPSYITDCILTIGESLDANRIAGLYVIGDEKRIGEMLKDALFNELNSGV